MTKAIEGTELTRVGPETCFDNLSNWARVIGIPYVTAGRRRCVRHCGKCGARSCSHAQYQLP
jgi:hypothetical protein